MTNDSLYLPMPASGRRGAAHTFLSFLPGILICMAGVQPAFASSGDAASANQLVYKVEHDRVRQERLIKKLPQFGSLEAFQDVAISPKIQGQIVAMKADEGSAVREGELLFELDSRAEEIALKRAQAEHQKAEHELAKMKAGSRPEEIEEARRRLNAAESLEAAAKDEWERIEKLAKEGIASSSVRVKVKSDYEVSSAQLSQAQARLDLVQSGFRNEDIMAAEAEVLIRKVQIDDIQRRLDDHRVYAPFTGVVSRRLKQAGEWTDSGESVLVLLDLDPMKLRVEIPQNYVGKINPGFKASVSVPGFEGGPFQAVVKAVIPQAQTATRNFPVLLELSNPDRRLAAGMYAQIELNIDEGRDALLVPREAVQYRDARMVVYRIDPLEEGSAIKGDPVPDGRVSEVEVAITRELERHVAVEPVNPSALWPECEIVIVGGNRLAQGSLIHRLAPVRKSAAP